MVGFKLQLLGKPTVVVDDGRLARGLPKKAFVAAALIARSQRRGLPKAELAEYLWPDLPAAHRANNLRQLLFRVRQFETLQDATIFQGDDDTIGLSPAVQCDLLEFEATDWSRGEGNAQRLLELYGGLLLDGYQPGDNALRRWLSEQRLQIQDQFVDAILSTTDGVTSELRKIALAKAIRIAPNAIGPRRALMRQLIADGQVQEARRQYREIEHIAGHGAVAAPPELAARATVRTTVSIPATAVPLAQVGRDQAGVPHLLLLPPRPAAGQDEHFAFAEALVDDVTVALTRLRSVSVVAPHTARKIAGGEASNATGLARTDFVLRTKLTTSSVRHRGRLPHLALVLEKVATGDIVWADGIAMDADIGPMQFAAMANGVALTLVDQIERSTLAAFQVPADAGAYGHYLLGQKALQVLDLPSIRRARASFKAALASSPHFAPAHAGFAQSMIYEWVTRGQGDPELILRAREAAERARDIDPLFGGAHQMLGRASLFEGDFSASLTHFERAEALNPHHADLLCDLADTLMHSSLPDRANDKIELALRLNPLAPDAYWWASAGIKFFVGDYEDALGHLGRVKNNEPVLRLTAACAAMADQPELARLARTKFLAIDPGFKLDDWIAVLPVRSPAHRSYYREALLKAGFT